MANLLYATGIASTSPAFGGIGWPNFGTVSLALGATLSFTGTFKDNQTTVSFNLRVSNSTGSAVTYVATQPPIGTVQSFGNTGYTGIGGKSVWMINQSSGTSTMIVSNISVKDQFGITVPNFYLIAGDAEASVIGEGQSYTTDGGNWVFLTNLPPVGGGAGATPSISGTGTKTITLTGVNNSNFTGPFFTTTNPSQVTLQATTAGFQGVGFGFAIDKVQLNKVINNRFFINDQFNLSVVGSASATTTTFGSTFGTQPVTAQVYTTNGNSFVLNETMASGSTSILSQYTNVIQYTNLSQGGTVVPSSTTLPGNVTLNLGDVIVATITNTIIPITIVSAKTVNENFADKSDTLTYTVVLRNTGSVSANNVIFIDTIPNGTTFVSNSLSQDGVPIVGNPLPPTGVNIGSIQANTTTTLVFQVTINNTIPNPNPIINTATGNFTYAVLPTTGVSGYNTNSTSTRVNSAILSSAKVVNKSFSNVGDILTYTIAISNSGNSTASNVVFIDTIPNGTTLVSNSLKQDGSIVSGSSNTPGTTLPNSIKPSGVTTITFQVTVVSIPNPNPIQNTATSTYKYNIDTTTTPNRIGSDSTNTNIVNTQVNNASLGGITKLVDKSFSTCGDTITYTIIAPNSGNVTALNVVFKDTIPNGTVLVPNSVFVNGALQSGANPATGVAIPNIGPGLTATLTFSVVVQC